MIFWCSDYLVFVARLLYILAPPLSRQSSPSRAVWEAASWAQALSFVYWVKHNFQFSGCAFFFSANRRPSLPSAKKQQALNAQKEPLWSPLLLTWRYLEYLNSSQVMFQKNFKTGRVFSPSKITHNQSHIWFHLLYDSGNSNWGSVTTKRSGEGWDVGGRGHMYTYGWFMLMMYGRNQINIVKPLSFN